MVGSGLVQRLVIVSGGANQERKYAKSSLSLICLPDFLGLAHVGKFDKKVCRWFVVFSNYMIDISKKYLVRILLLSPRVGCDP